PAGRQPRLVQPDHRRPLTPGSPPGAPHSAIAARSASGGVVPPQPAHGVAPAGRRVGVRRTRRDRVRGRRASVVRSTTAGGGAMSRRRAVARLAGGGALAGVLAACGAPGGAGEGAAPAAKAPVRLTYVLHNTAKRDVDAKHVPEYTDKNPHVSVEFSLVPDA